MKRGGFDVFAGLLEPRYLEAMQAEAVALYEESAISDVSESVDSEERGGSPARRFASGRGGPVQDAFYHAAWLAEFLSDLTCASVRPTGDQATFSYYVRPGDHIDVHRDIETCDLAVITCLPSNEPRVGGDSLLLSPPNADWIRATPRSHGWKVWAIVCHPLRRALATAF